MTNVSTHEKAPEATGLTGEELQELAKIVRGDILDMVEGEDRRLEKLVMGAAKHLEHEDEGRAFVEEHRIALRALEKRAQDKVAAIINE